MKTCWLGMLVVLMTAFCARGEEPQEKDPPRVFGESINMDKGPNIDASVEIQQDGRIVIYMHVWHNTMLRGYTANIRITFRDNKRNYLFSVGPFDYGLGARDIPFAAPHEPYEQEEVKVPDKMSSASIEVVEFIFWAGGSKDSFKAIERAAKPIKEILDVSIKSPVTINK